MQKYIFLYIFLYCGKKLYEPYINFWYVRNKIRIYFYFNIECNFFIYRAYKKYTKNIFKLHMKIYKYMYFIYDMYFIYFDYK